MSADHDHASQGTHRSKLTIVVGITAAILVAEALGAWWTNSLALLVDAGYMLTAASGGVTGQSLPELLGGRLPRGHALLYWAGGTGRRRHGFGGGHRRRRGSQHPLWPSPAAGRADRRTRLDGAIGGAVQAGAASLSSW